MNWSTTPPTKPGFYAWRETEDWSPIALSVVKEAYLGTLVCADGIDGGPMELPEKGEWLRLVPAEEIEKAYKEGFNAPADIGEEVETVWPLSRAKQIAEGTL